MAKASTSTPWLTVRNEASAPAAEIVISGRIGGEWWDESGKSSREFRKEFDAIPAGRKINLRINSEGGTVMDGLEMHNLIARRAADVTGYNEGYCLSSATLVLLACGKTICPPSSLFMIHEPWGGTIGNEDDHRRAAEMLAKHGDTIAGIYAKRLGKPVDEMRALMRAETWYTGEEAKSFGFADECEPEDPEHEQEEMASDHAPTRAELDQITSRYPNLDFGQFKNGLSKALALLGRSSQRALNTPNTQRPHNTPMPETVTPAPAVSAAAVATPAPQTTPQAAAPASAVSAAEVEALRQQIAQANARFDSEKRTRITAEVTRRAENKIQNGQLAWWVNLAMQDEAGTLAQLDNLPVNRPGGEPLALNSGIQVMDSRFEAIKKLPTAEARYSALRNDWEPLMQDALVRDSRSRGPVMNDNTYSSSLVTAILADGAVTVLTSKLGALKCFTRDFSIDLLKPLATVQVPLVTSGATVQTDATNFESGDSVVTNKPITVNQYSASFHVTNAELNSGLRMENLITINLAAFGDKIMDIAVAPITEANFATHSPIVRAPAAFGFSDLAEAWGKLKKSDIRNAVLDGEYMARILNQPAFFQAAGLGSGAGWKAFGWDNVELNTRWTGVSSENTRGFVCNPQALAVGSGLPVDVSSFAGAVLKRGTITIPGAGLTIATHSWFSVAGRKMWMSYDVMFGSALLDGTAGVLVQSE